MMIERFDHADRRSSRQQQILEQQPRVCRPRTLHDDCGCPQAIQRGALNRHVTLRRRDCDIQGQERLAVRPRTVVETDLALALDNTVTDWSHGSGAATG
jgi:hypothetical protein